MEPSSESSSEEEQCEEKFPTPRAEVGALSGGSLAALRVLPVCL